jgi:hypothetical protein
LVTLAAPAATDPELAEVQTAVPKVIDGILVEPLLAHAVRGIWFVRVATAGAN